MRVLTQRMVRRANSYQWPVIAREIDARVGHQGGEPGDKVEQLKHHVQMEYETRAIAGLAQETHDAREGINAFSEKRKPKFEGR